MPERICLFVFLVILAVGCGAASPPPTESQAAPTANVAPTVETATSSQSSSPTPTRAESAPTETPTVVPKEEPTLEPTVAIEPAADSTKSVPVVPTEVPPGSEVVEPSALANQMSRDLMVSFVHTNPDYIAWVKGTFLFIEDGQFCAAADRFVLLVSEARSYDGERLIDAAYNAGVAYMMAGWDDQNPGHSHNEHLCMIRNTDHPLGYSESALNIAIRHLNGVLPHLTDEKTIAGANLMLGRAYVNKAIKADDFMNQNVEEDRAAFKGKATGHLCGVLEAGGDYAESASEILAEYDGSCGQ